MLATSTAKPWMMMMVVVMVLIGAVWFQELPGFVAKH